MNESKRNFLKVLPLAAMVPSALALGDTKVAAYEIAGPKKYLIVVPDSVLITEAEALRMKQILDNRGINATVITGVEGLKVYELDG